MTDVLRQHIVAGYFCVYTDDILIFTDSDDPAEHMLKLGAVLETLRKIELLVKGAKLELFRREVEFLGFKISAKGWSPTESKITTMVEWPAPETVKHLLTSAPVLFHFNPTLRTAVHINASQNAVGSVLLQ